MIKCTVSCYGSDDLRSSVAVEMSGKFRDIHAEYHAMCMGVAKAIIDGACKDSGKGAECAARMLIQAALKDVSEKSNVKEYHDYGKCNKSRSSAV